MTTVAGTCDCWTVRLERRIWSEVLRFLVEATVEVMPAFTTPLTLHDAIMLLEIDAEPSGVR